MICRGYLLETLSENFKVLAERKNCEKQCYILGKKFLNVFYNLIGFTVNTTFIYLEKTVNDCKANGPIDLTKLMMSYQVSSKMDTHK